MADGVSLAWSLKFGDRSLKRKKEELFYMRLRRSDKTAWTSSRWKVQGTERRAQSDGAPHLCALRSALLSLDALSLSPPKISHQKKTHAASFFLCPITSPPVPGPSFLQWSPVLRCSRNRRGHPGSIRRGAWHCRCLSFLY